MASDAATQPTLDLGVIGNCRTAALLDTGGRIVWWCFPRFDSDPVFSRLLAGEEEKGFCDVQLEGAVARDAAYIRNTAMIRTTIRDAAGNAPAETGIRIGITHECHIQSLQRALDVGIECAGDDVHRPASRQQVFARLTQDRTRRRNIGQQFP